MSVGASVVVCIMVSLKVVVVMVTLWAVCESVRGRALLIFNEKMDQL